MRQGAGWGITQGCLFLTASSSRGGFLFLTTPPLVSGVPRLNGVGPRGFTSEVSARVNAYRMERLSSVSFVSMARGDDGREVFEENKDRYDCLDRLGEVYGKCR